MLEDLRNQFDYYELDYLDIKEIREFIIEQKIIDAYELISNRLCCTNLALDAYLVISFQNE